MLVNLQVKIPDGEHCSGCKYIRRMCYPNGFVDISCRLFNEWIFPDKKDRRRKKKCRQCLKLVNTKSNNKNNLTSYNKALNHIRSRINFTKCGICKKSCNNYKLCAILLFDTADSLDKDNYNIKSS